MHDSFQTRIKWLRDDGMTLREVADRVGMPHNTLCDVARGDTMEPRGWAAVRLYMLSELHRPSPVAQA